MRYQCWVAPLLLVTSVQAVWPFKSSTSTSTSLSSPTSIPSYEELLILLEQEENAEEEVVVTVTTTVAEVVTPSPVVSPVVAKEKRKEPEEYNGLKYKLGPYTFKPYELKKEFLILLALIAYYLSSVFGASISTKHATAWFNSNLDVIKNEFSRIGMGTKRFAKDGGDEFVSFATGRRAIESVTIRVYTQARHDLLIALFNFISLITNTGTAKDTDKIVLKFKLLAPVGTPECKFIFAITQKTALSSLLASRWDLRTFGQVFESIPGGNNVPNDLIIISESLDIATPIIKDERRAFGLIEGLLNDVEGREFFESLVISDAPSDRSHMDEDKPKLPTDEYYLTLTLRLPPIHQVALTKPFITLACNIADVLYAKPALLGPVTIFKLKKARTEQQAKLNEPEEEKLRLARIAKKDEEAVAKAKIDKAAEDLRIKKMSKEERNAHFAKIKADKAEKLAELKEIEKKEAELKAKQRRR